MMSLWLLVVNDGQVGRLPNMDITNCAAACYLQQCHKCSRGIVSARPISLGILRHCASVGHSNDMGGHQWACNIAYIMVTPCDTLGQLRSNIHLVEYTGSGPVHIMVTLWHSWSATCELWSRAGHYDKWHGIAGRQIGLQDGFNNEFCSRQCNDLQIAVCSILNVSSITARTFHNTFARSFFVHLPVRLFFVDWLVGLFICSLVHSFIRLVWRYIYDK